MNRIFSLILVIIMLSSFSVNALTFEEVFDSMVDEFYVLFSKEDLTGFLLVGGGNDDSTKSDGGGGTYSKCDKDNDGYKRNTILCQGSDCNDNNAAINPNAIEICGDGIDNNCNVQIDCGDISCNGINNCEYLKEVSCNDVIDNDGDGLVDCADSDCANDQSCGGQKSLVCGDGIINGAEVCDGDTITCTILGIVGTKDCKSDCSGYEYDPICDLVDQYEGEDWTDIGGEICSNSIDDDGDCTGDTNNDGQVCGPGDDGVDCKDIECYGNVNGYGYGYTCCATDNDCSYGTICGGDYLICEESICGDKVDNEGDGYFDCADWDCSSDSYCSNLYGTFEFDCGDGLDNDQDFKTDCEDYECYSDPLCIAYVPNSNSGSNSNTYNSAGIGSVQEICGDGLDNDQDGYSDCFDTDCYCGDSSESFVNPSSGSAVGSNQGASQIQTLDRGMVNVRFRAILLVLIEVDENLEILMNAYGSRKPVEANDVRKIRKNISIAHDYLVDLIENGDSWDQQKHDSMVLEIRDILNNVIRDSRKL